MTKYFGTLLAIASLLAFSGCLVRPYFPVERRMHHVERFEHERGDHHHDRDGWEHHR